MREDLEGLMQLKELKLYLQLDGNNHFAYPIFFIEYEKENAKSKSYKILEHVYILMLVSIYSSTDA